MKYVSFFVLIAVLVATHCLAGHKLDIDRDALVRDFFLALAKEPPTLADYYRFYGQGREFELNFELMCCLARGSAPYSQTCIDFTRERAEADPESRPSRALTWLKTQLPTNATARILRVAMVPNTEVEETTICIGPVTATFIRDVTTTDIGFSGEFSLDSINGVSVFQASFNMLNTCEAQGNCTCLLPH